MSKTRNLSPRVELSEKQRKGRIANSIAELLTRKLLVPRIFLEPKGLKVFFDPKFRLNENPWVDVLAIDRAGSGDTYGVVIVVGANWVDLINNKQLFDDFVMTYIRKAAIHFKYIAVDSELVGAVSKPCLFAEDGIGRVGVIAVKERLSQPPEVEIVIPAERFRVKGRWMEEMDRFQKTTPADMEIRD